MAVGASPLDHAHRQSHVVEGRGAYWASCEEGGYCGGEDPEDVSLLQTWRQPWLQQCFLVQEVGQGTLEEVARQMEGEGEDGGLHGAWRGHEEYWELHGK